MAKQRKPKQADKPEETTALVPRHGMRWQYKLSYTMLIMSLITLFYRLFYANQETTETDASGVVNLADMTGLGLSVLGQAMEPRSFQAQLATRFQAEESFNAKDKTAIERVFENLASSSATIRCHLEVMLREPDFKLAPLSDKKVRRPRAKTIKSGSGEDELLVTQGVFDVSTSTLSLQHGVSEMPADYLGDLMTHELRHAHDAFQNAHGKRCLLAQKKGAPLRAMPFLFQCGDKPIPFNPRLGTYEPDHSEIGVERINVISKLVNDMEARYASYVEVYNSQNKSHPLYSEAINAWRKIHDLINQHKYRHDQTSERRPQMLSVHLFNEISNRFQYVRNGYDIDEQGFELNASLEGLFVQLPGLDKVLFPELAELRERLTAGPYRACLML
jgi:hypothetical protein